MSRLTDPSTHDDRRRDERRRRRLHAARVTDATGRFLGEGSLADMSQEGARLRLTAPADLPRRVLLFDETNQRVAGARLMWSRGIEIGLLLDVWKPLDSVDPALRRRLQSAYYARE